MIPLPVRNRKAVFGPSLMVLVLAACSLPVAPEENAPYVLRMRLQNGTDSQVAKLSHLATGDPLAGVPVSLRLEGADGSTPLAPATTPGQWVAMRRITPGEEYRLEGEIDGHPVSGLVRLPGPLSVLRRVDTVDLRQSVVKTISYQWSASGAATYLVDYLIPARPLLEAYGSVFRTADPVGTYPSSYFPVYGGRNLGRDTTVRFLLTAADPNLAAWLHYEANPTLPVPVSTLRGAYGFLGGGIRDSLALLIHQ